MSLKKISFLLCLLLAASFAQDYADDVPETQDHPDTLVEKDLHNAIRARNMKNVHKALGQGADVNHRFDDGDTSLIVATRENWGDVVPVLFQHNLDLKHHGWHLLPILHYASKLGKHKVVAEICKGQPGLHVDEREHHNQEFSALHYAAIGETNDHTKTVGALVEHCGAHMNVLDIDGMTALDLAVHPPTREYLIGRGAAGHGGRSKDDLHGHGGGHLYNEDL